MKKLAKRKLGEKRVDLWMRRKKKGKQRGDTREGKTRGKGHGLKGDRQSGTSQRRKIEWGRR